MAKQLNSHIQGRQNGNRNEKTIRASVLMRVGLIRKVRVSKGTRQKLDKQKFPLCLIPLLCKVLSITQQGFSKYAFSFLISRQQKAL